MDPKTIRNLSVVLFAALVGWGLYAFLSYLGASTHLQALLPDSVLGIVDRTVVVKDSACGPGQNFCNGLSAFFPFLANAFVRLSLLLPYVIIFLLLYGVYAVVQWLNAQSTVLRFTLRPWHVMALFLVSTWLLFTTISLSSIDGIPMGRLANPTQDVYQDVGEEAMQTLRENFDDLQSRGCLRSIGQTDKGVELYDMRATCMQESFVTRVLPQMLASFLLLFELLVLGRAMLWLLRLRPRSTLTEAAISLGLGTFGLIGLLWLLSILGVYVQPAGWALVVLIPAALYTHTRYWLRALFQGSWEVEVQSYGASVLFLWLVITYLAFNFLTVIRPFPIGWDDLGSYLNRPRLLVSYGRFIPAMASFQWEYITSLGFLLLGYNSDAGATMAMILNWTAGVVAVFAVYAFARTWLGRNRGLLAALLYYSLPMVGHFSFADMKIDNALFAVGVLAILAMFHAFFPPPAAGEEVTASDRWKWVGVAGFLAGVAFGIKVTAAMLLMALGMLLMGITLGVAASVTASLLALAAFTYRGVFNAEGIVARIVGGDSPISNDAFMLACVIVGLGLLVFTGMDRTKWRTFGVSFGVFVLGFFGAIAPWVAYNNYASGNIIPKLVLGLPNNLTTSIDLHPGAAGSNVRTLPPDLAVDLSNPACKPSGSVEELDRYWGFDKGIGHYATLPWRLVLNLDSSGYYVMTSFILLLFPLLLLLPYFWTPRGRWLRWLTGMTTFLLVEWMFMANGIPWYGIAMFLGLVVGIEALVARAPDALSRWTASGLVVLSLLSVFSLRLWQWEQQRNLFEYPMGKISGAALRERTIQHYDRISQIIVNRHDTMPDRPYLYRIGTFIPYFIPRNLEIIGIGDQQLDLFKCLNQEKNHALTLQRIKALGFNSMIFDTNTQTIESDPQGSLHQKVQEFMDWANDPALKLQIVVNDPGAGVAFLLLP